VPFLFEKTLGRVYRLDDPVAQGTIGLASISANAVGPGGNDLGFRPSCRTLITKVGLSNAGNFQFLHTMGNEVYVYVFGDRMGQIVLHGLSFQGDCTSGGEEHGFDQVYDWYKANRVATKSEPVIITIGIRTRFHGFITSFTADAQDSQNMTIPFQVTVAILPENN